METISSRTHFCDCRFSDNHWLLWASAAGQGVARSGHLGRGVSMAPPLTVIMTSTGSVLISKVASSAGLIFPAALVRSRVQAAPPSAGRPSAVEPSVEVPCTVLDAGAVGDAFDEHAVTATSTKKTSLLYSITSVLELTTIGRHSHGEQVMQQLFCLDDFALRCHEDGFLGFTRCGVGEGVHPEFRCSNGRARRRQRAPRCCHCFLVLHGEHGCLRATATTSSGERSVVKKSRRSARVTACVAQRFRYCLEQSRA